jgi:hypothetical protein
MYLACLEDLLKSFPPTDLYDIKSLDVKNSPYISLVKIIASQLGLGCSFIVDPDVSTHEVEYPQKYPNKPFKIWIIFWTLIIKNKLNLLTFLDA